MCRTLDWTLIGYYWILDIIGYNTETWGRVKQAKNHTADHAHNALCPIQYNMKATNTDIAKNNIARTSFSRLSER